MGDCVICQRHAAQDHPKSVLSFLALCCTPVPALVGDKPLRTNCRNGVSLPSAGRIHPEEIKKIVKKTSRYFLGVPSCTTFSSCTSLGHAGADSLHALGQR